MAAQNARPDSRSLDRRRRNQPRQGRNPKISALAVTLIVGVGLVACSDESSGVPVDQTTDTTPTASTPDEVGDVSSITVATGEKASGPEFGIDASAWSVSPDGTRVTFIARTTPTGPEIVHVADLDGSNVRAYEATVSPDNAQDPSWSPDGATIVYQANGDESVGDLFLLDVASGEVRQLTDLEPMVADFWPMSPTFVSDGDTVVFLWPTSRGSGDDLRGDLWAVPVTGGEPTPVRQDAGFVDASPDGTKIAFNEFAIVGGQSTVGPLWVSDADGANAERLVDGLVTLSRWSPDGTRIVYADEGRDRLMILDLVSGERVSVPAAAVGVDWVDDATLMVGHDD